MAAKILTHMPVGLLPRICVLYELEAGPEETSTSWRASYFANRDEARLLLERCRDDRKILQYEIFKLRYDSDGGGRRGCRLEVVSSS